MAKYTVTDDDFEGTGLMNRVYGFTGDDVKLMKKSYDGYDISDDEADHLEDMLDRAAVIDARRKRYNLPSIAEIQEGAKYPGAGKNGDCPDWKPECCDNCEKYECEYNTNEAADMYPSPIQHNRNMVLVKAKPAPVKDYHSSKHNNMNAEIDGIHEDDIKHMPDPLRDHFHREFDNNRKIADQVGMVVRDLTNCLLDYVTEAAVYRTHAQLVEMCKIANESIEDNN